MTDRLVTSSKIYAISSKPQFHTETLEATHFPRCDMRCFSTVLCLLGFLQGLAYAQNATLSVSQDGSCGASVNQTCLKSTFGNCCSGRGYCGGTNDYCSPTNGCQTAYGSCTQSSVISVDGRCGSQDPLHQVCIGSEFGSCCSTNGWCGNTTTYCGQGCQSSAGTCGGSGITINTGSNATSSSSSSISTSTGGSPTYTSSAASSATSSATSSASSELESTRSSLKAMQAGLGVVAALLAIALIAIVWLVFFRKGTKKASSQEHLEKPHTDIEDRPSHSSHVPINPVNMVSPMSEAPHPSYSTVDNMNRWQDSKADAQELGTHVGVAELNGTEGGVEKGVDKKY